MTATLRIAGPALLLLALAACNRQGPDVPKQVDDNREAVNQGDGIQPVMVSPDAAKVGSEANEAGDILTEARTFELGQKVYISVPTKFGRKIDEKLEIFWFHDDGLSRREETKRIAGPFTVFEFTPTDAGPYNVEVDANGRPIALAQFEVK
ncbi:MAG TPA: hypothetical protein VLC71_00995 [Thermomonas sp.]|nr:hypothetical protein [Thermomonas sp.]